MTSPYENKLFATYLLNACKAWQDNGIFLNVLAEELEMKADYFGINYKAPRQRIVEDDDDEDTKKKKVRYVSSRSKKMSKENAAKLQEYLERVAKKFEKAEPDEDYAVLNAFTADLGLNQTEQRVCEFLLATQRFEPMDLMLSSLYNLPNKQGRRRMEHFAAFLGLQPKELSAVLSHSGSMLSSGIVYFDSFDEYGERLDGEIPYYLNDRIANSINGNAMDLAALRQRLIGSPVKANLAWDDFEHMGPSIDLCARLLNGALEKKAKGVNILIYGDPGTGKTEFCRALAEKLNIDLYAIGEKSAVELSDVTDNQQAGESPMARMSDMRLVQRILVGQSQRVALSFDEAEDLLSVDAIETNGGKHSSMQGGKRVSNRLLEDNTVPVLYTTNNAERFDEAFLRRFTFAVEMSTPPADVRARVLARALHQQGQSLTAHAIKEVATNYALPPSAFSNAAQVMALAGGNEQDVEMSLRSMSRLLLDGQGETEHKTPDCYDLSLFNTDVDLKNLAQQIKGSGQLGFNICLYGVSGAGKTEYAHYLGRTLGLRTRVIKYSEISSKYVGETEKKIAAAFARAREERSILIIDEADSLLRSRDLAQQSWEVTQINEMLAQMENHPLPLIGSTNLMQDVDGATLRRFVFKVQFKPLTTAQSAHAFNVFFKQPLPEGMALPETLTPGDFANVAKQASFLGTDKDPAKLHAALMAEANTKRKARGFDAFKTKPIGFNTPEP